LEFITKFRNYLANPDWFIQNWTKIYVLVVIYSLNKAKITFAFDVLLN